MMCQFSLDSIQGFFALGGINILQHLFDSGNYQQILESMQLLESLLPSNEVGGLSPLTMQVNKIKIFKEQPELMISLA